jgi:hypothetical protein
MYFFSGLQVQLQEFLIFASSSTSDDLINIVELYKNLALRFKGKVRIIVNQSCLPIAR